MKSVVEQLAQRTREALAHMGADTDPLIQASQDDKFGDYQCNAAMSLAKRLGKKPRDVAQTIIDNLSVEDICEPPEIAGPGFINFRLRPAWLAEQLAAIPRATELDADRLGLPRAERPEIVIVDLSSPNLAKEMHVGHLRSTVIGDCVARILEFAGHTVHRENHVGDWGTQFGMLVAYLRQPYEHQLSIPHGFSGTAFDSSTGVGFEVPVGTNDDIMIDLADVLQAGDERYKLRIEDLEVFYVKAKARFDADETFRMESRKTVVALQSGDPTIRRIWEAFCHESLRHCHAIYERLDVRLTDRGESFYNDLMSEVVRRLEKIRDSGANTAVRDSEGALCIFPEGFTTREGEPLPVIVRKSDGGFNYATSDLATLLHRIETLRATRIVYVVGLSQKQHFDMLFAAARKVGWVGPDVRLEHLGFGNMLTQAGTPFKTREGGTIKLKDLLDEAVTRARRVVQEQQPDEMRPQRDFTPQQSAAIAETVGLAAIKYFDLSHALSSDYRFDPDTMLNLEGNTAPYMLYAYARIRSIGRKAGIDFAELPAGPIVLEHPAEIALAKKLVQFADVLEIVARELRPNVLTDYLYELAKMFSRFYDKKLGVRVIDASPAELRLSRLRLCDLTARVLRLGLSLLGIATIEHM